MGGATSTRTLARAGLNKDAAWHYADTKTTASPFKGLFAFQHGVRVVERFGQRRKWG